MAGMREKVMVDVVFSADTGQAKSQLQDLKNTLNSLSTQTFSGSTLQPMTQEIRQGQEAALRLKSALEQATNVDTGRLNLTNFTQSLHKSGMSLQQYANKLTALGPAGEKAFLQTSQAIMSGELPLKRSNALMGELWTTMKNTAKWQLSSSVLHGFISAAQEAFNYAQDLNKSLNEIRIVTNYNSGDMAKFAKEANAAAKALNTTTKAYTDASLIYFQQGLGGSEIKERTETTIKMANVTGENAQEVSDYMTAVWNNFDNGSKSLEYYADVMAALGAATASSTDEIAAGLEKFAGIANTVGLSYEYATSALATVTAETRQSADVVGTAFKTLFARIQGLSLGETLEDGTDLNKYSQSLAVVGVNIKDASGQLKDMDQILNELGNRWQGLTKDQQVAVAQSVAGIRQYNQLISLMDNWDVMQTNLDTAANAEGTLEKQAEIYADSWEAAQNQVKASAEEIYSSLIDDKFFIDLTQGFAGFLDVIGDISRALGGLPGVISLLGTIMMKAFGPHIADSINNMWSNFLVGSGMAKQSAEMLKNDLLNTLQTWNKGLKGTGGSGELEVQYQMQQVELAHELYAIYDDLDSEEQRYLKDMLARLGVMQEQTVELKKQAEEADSVTTTSGKELTGLEESDESFEQRRQEAHDKVMGNMTEPGSMKHKEKYNAREEKADEAADSVKRITEETVRSEAKSAGKLSEMTVQDEILEDDLSDVDFFAGLSDDGLSSEAMQQTRENLSSIFGEEVAANVDAYIELLKQVEQELDAIDESLEDVDKLDQDVLNAESALTEAQKGGNKDDIKKKQADLDKAKRKQEKGHYQKDKQIVETSKDETAVAEAKERMQTTKKSKVSKKASLVGKDDAKNLKKMRKEMTKFAKDTEKTDKGIKKWSQNIEKRTGKSADALEDFGKKSIEAGKLNGKANAAITLQSRIQEDYKESLQKSAQGMKNFGTSVSNGMQGVSSFAMGLSSLKGAFDAIHDPDLSWFEKFTSVAMSLGMGLPSLVDGIGRMGASFKGTKAAIIETTTALFGSAAAEQAEGKAVDDNTKKKGLKALISKWENSETIQNTLHSMANTQAEKKNAAAQSGSTVAKLAHAAAQAVLTAAMGPFGVICLVIMAILIAMVAIILIVIAAINAFTKAQEAQNQKTLEQEKANQELIASNKELTDSVQGLIDQYQEFKATGEDTVEVLQKLKDQMPELIKSYKELERNLGIDLNIEELEQAYKDALSSGNWDDVEMKINKIEAQILEAEQASFNTGSKAAGRSMANAGKDDLGHMDKTNSKYKIHIGGSGLDDENANDIMRDVFEKKGISSYIDDSNKAVKDQDSVDLTMDLSSPTAMVNYYEALQEVQSQLEATGDTSSATYEEITEELEQMKESYDEAKIQADGYLKSLAESIDNLSKSEYADAFGVSAEEVDSLAEYNANIDSMVKHYAQKKKISEEEARSIIEASEAFSQYANTAASIENKAEVLYTVQTGNDRHKTSKETIKNELSTIYDGLTEDEKTLFLNLNVNDLDPKNLETSVKEAIEKAKEDALVAEVKLEAEELELDEAAFESYADILLESNEHLEGNKAMAYKVALQNARLSKGLVTLTDNFKDNVSVLAKGNRSTYEYAEAIGALKDGFEEMFGYKPSTVYIEGHLEEIQELANGNLDVLQDLQDDLAKDYVLNMEVGTAINTDVEGMSTDEVRNELQAMLDSIDTSLEIGEGTTISDDYLNSMQAMLDQGQITEEQMQEMFRMKGIEMKVTGYKKVPGPKTTTTQTITGPLGISYKKTIEEQQDMQIPIINGDDSNIYGGSGAPITDLKGNKLSKTEIDNIEKDDAYVAQFAKSSDANSIDTSSFEESSGAKEREKKIKELEKEKDIYHDTSRELQRLEREYDKLDKAKERAYGKQKLAIMEQQNKLLEDEISQLEKEQELANQAAKDLQGEGIDTYGLSFYSDSGEIANYNEVYAREEAYYKAAINSGDENAIAEAEERWANFNDLVSEYEQRLDEAHDKEEEIADKQAEIYDSYLEGLEYTLEIKLEIDDSQLEYLEYQLSKIEDDAFKAAEQIALLGEQTSVLMDKGEAYKSNINDLLGKHGLTLDQASSMSGEELLAAGFTEAEIQSLREWTSGLMENNQALLENKAAIQDSLMPIYEAWGEKFDQQTEKVEHAISVLDHYQNVVDLVGKKRLGMTDKDLINMADAQVQVANDNLEIAQNRYEAAQASRAKAAEELKEAKARAAADPKNKELQKDVEYWEGIFNDLDADVRAQEQNRNAMLEAALEAAAEKYRLVTESILNDFEKGLSAVGKDLETMSEDYARSQEIDERYIDEYTKMYELNKLSRDLENKLSKSNSLAEQEAIRKQLEKINKYKEEGVEMSEHDLEILQKEIEAEQARIAMEEAQNAKTQVVRRRDSEGNYGYVYTADTDKASEAAQTYEDKMYEIYKANDEYIDSLGEKILQAQIEMREALAAINEEDFASREEYMAKVNEVTDYYNGMINYYYDEMNKSINSNAEIYGQDLETRLGWSAESIGISNEQLVAISQIRKEDYKDLDAYYAAVEERTGLDRETIKQLDENGTLAHIEEIGKQIGANDELQLSFEDTKYAQATEFETMEQAQDAFTTATETMVDNLDQAYTDHEQDIEESLNEVGMTLGDSSEEYTNFKEHVQDEISGPDGVVAQSGEAADSTDEMKDDMVEDFGDAADAVGDWQEKYSAEIGEAIDANDLMIESLNDMIEKLSEASQAIIDYANTQQTYGGGSGNGNYGGNTSNVTGNVTTENSNTTTAEPKDEVSYNWSSKSIDSYMKHEDKEWNMWYTDEIQNTAYWTSTGKGGTSKFGDMILTARKRIGKPDPEYWWVKKGAYSSGAGVGKHPDKGCYAMARKKGDNKTRTPDFDSVVTLDTGGYTGAWGSEGRMAMLHQKELVLNAQDTENFLLATTVLRDIVAKIELASLASALKTNITAQGIDQSLNNNNEQNITIHAEFPDATNHNEIEEAFNSLILRASQYANRK